MASGPPQTRGLLVNIWRNFKKSFRVLEKGAAISGAKGDLVGTDPYGNRYYEIPPDPSRGRRRSQRWFENSETKKKDFIGVDNYSGYDSNIPAEWESWLRQRRDAPPTYEQVLQSLQLAEMKKINAAKLEAKRIEDLKAENRYEGPPKPQDHEKPTYPKYAEFEVMPGEHNLKEKDKWESHRNPYYNEAEQKPK